MSFFTNSKKCIIFLSLSIISCGDSIDDSRTLSQEIIFDEPSMDTIPYISEEAHNEFNAGNRSHAHNLWQKMQISRGQGRLPMSIYIQNGAVPVNGVSPTAKGSGQLAMGSTSLAWSAHHVTAVLQAYYDEEAMLVTTPNEAPSLQSIWANDDLYNEVTFAEDWFNEVNSSLVNSDSRFKDDWMLRNRLHSMGLITLAKSSSYEELKEDFETWEKDNIIVVKNYSDSPNSNGEVRDVSLLRFIPKQIDAPYLQAPTWALGGPGVTQNSKRIICNSSYISEPICKGYYETSPGDPVDTIARFVPMTFDWIVTAIPSPPYNTSVGLNSVQSLISRLFINASGVWDNRILSSDSMGTTTCNNTGCVDSLAGYFYASPRNMWANAVIDTRSGHSGGPAYAYNKRFITPNLDAGSSVINWIGVQSAISHDSSNSQAVTQDNKRASVEDNSPYHYGPVSEANRLLEVHLAMFTPGMDQDVRKRLGVNGFPHRSSFGCFRNCYDNCAYSAITPNGDPDPVALAACEAVAETELANTNNDGSTTNDPVLSDSWKCLGKGCLGGISTERVSSTFKLIGCEDSYFAGRPKWTGTAYGVVGEHGLSDELDICKDHAVGGGRFTLHSAGAICGPRSQSDWTMNFDFLEVYKTTSPTGCGYYTQPRTMLNDYYVQSFTSMKRVGRNEGKDIPAVSTLNPSAALLCPPGYAMKGLRIGYDNSDKHIKGIKGIYCSSVNIHPDIDECQMGGINGNIYPCYVPAQITENNGTQAYKGNSNENGNLQLPLIQHLGDSRADDGISNLIENSCPKGYQISEMRISNSNPTEFIDFKCAPIPGFKP